MTKRIDIFAIAVLFVLGCIHNFLAAPNMYDELDVQSLWFITGGIVLWFAAAINLLGLLGERGSFECILVLFCNAVLIGFSIIFMWVQNSWDNPQNIALVAPALWLFTRGVFSFRTS